MTNLITYFVLALATNWTPVTVGTNRLEVGEVRRVAVLTTPMWATNIVDIGHCEFIVRRNENVNIVTWSVSPTNTWIGSPLVWPVSRFYTNQ